MKLATPQTQTEFNDILRVYTTTVYGYGIIRDNINNKAWVGLQKNGNQWVELVSRNPIWYSITWSPRNPSGDGICTEMIVTAQNSGLNDLTCARHTRNYICEKTGNNQ